MKRPCSGVFQQPSMRRCSFMMKTVSCRVVCAGGCVLVFDVGEEPTDSLPPIRVRRLLFFVPVPLADYMLPRRANEALANSDDYYSIIILSVPRHILLYLAASTSSLRTTESASQWSSVHSSSDPPTYKALLVFPAEGDDLLLDCVCVVVYNVGEEYGSSVRMVDRIDFGGSWAYQLSSTSTCSTLSLLSPFH
ncbi:hypothetical protein Efla_004199 [Eimeria flavescens]